jgi:hypothetical protein
MPFWFRAGLAPLLVVAAACSHGPQRTVIVPATRTIRPLVAPAQKAPRADGRDATVAKAGALADAGDPAALHRGVLPDRAAVMANRFCAAAQVAAERITQKIAAELDISDHASAFGAWTWLSESGNALEGSGPTCLPMRDGSAWAIEFLPGKTHRWTLTHYSTDGQRQALAPMRVEELAGGDFLGPGQVVAFDFDGDGLEEFWVESTLTCGREPAQKVYTFRAGRMIPYPVPGDPRVDEIHDVDQDGRPDLFTRSPLEVDEVPCSFGDILCAGYGFTRVLHSLPDGTFSVDDATVRGQLDEICSEHPPEQPLVVRRADAPAEVDGEKTADAIACARLRGMPSERIASELKARCPSILRSREARRHPNPHWGDLSVQLSPAEQARQRRACPSTLLHSTCIDWMFDLARATPELVLSPPQAGDSAGELRGE